MDKFAMNVGYVVLVCGGLSLTGLILAFCIDYIWRKLRDAHGLAEMIAAHRKYKAKPQESAQ